MIIKKIPLKNSNKDIFLNNVPIINKTNDIVSFV